MLGPRASHLAVRALVSLPFGRVPAGKPAGQTSFSDRSRCWRTSGVGIFLVCSQRVGKSVTAWPWTSAEDLPACRADTPEGGGYWGRAGSDPSWDEFVDSGGQRGQPGGAEAGVVGRIVAEPAASVVMVTAFGGTRLVDMLVGDPLPRIC